MKRYIFTALLVSALVVTGTASAYTVKKGDTFCGIANNVGISCQQLKELNQQIKDYNLIHPGDEVNTEELLGFRPTPSEVRVSDGSVSAPTMTFVNDLDTGIYRIGNNNLGITAGGTKMIDVTSSGVTLTGTLTPSGNLNPATDNLYDIGASSTAWRYGNFRQGLLVSDAGTTTSTLSSNSLILGQTSGSNLGKFYVDSSGNVNASGSIYSSSQIGFVGDSNTYIYQSSGDAFNFVIGGSLSQQFYAGVIYSDTYRSYGSNVVTLRGHTADSSTAVAVALNAGVAFTTAGAKIVSIRNNSVEKAFFDLNGELSIGGGTATSTLSSSTLKLAVSSSNALGKFYVDGSGNVSASGTITSTDSNSSSILSDRDLVLNVSATDMGTGKFFINSTGNVSSSGTTFVMPLATNITGNGVCITTTNNITNAGAAACVPSALRYKENIKPLSMGLNEILKMRPVEFDYKKGVRNGDRHSFGMIAEEVEKINPKLVSFNEKGQPETIKYIEMTGVVVKGIQELNDKNDKKDAEQDSRLGNLEKGQLPAGSIPIGYQIAFGLLIVSNIVLLLKKKGK